MKLLICWSFHLGFFTALLKKIQTCTGLPSNLCSSCLGQEYCVSICQNLQERLEQDPEFLLKIIISDDAWVCEYDQETKQQSSQWKIITSKPKQGQDHSDETPCLLFFQHSKSCAYEFVPQETIVNQHYYLKTLYCLHKNVWQT